MALAITTLAVLVGLAIFDHMDQVRFEKEMDRICKRRHAA